jgi:hypothetical protein
MLDFEEIQRRSAKLGLYLPPQPTTASKGG